MIYANGTLVGLLIEKEILEDMGADGIIIRKQILETKLRVYNGFNYLRVRV
jgi:hypothetical protein